MFYYLSKILWFFTVPSNLIPSITLFGLLLLIWGKRKKAGIFLSLSSLFLFFLCGLGPVANWVMLPLEQRFPTFDEKQIIPITGIIILGGAAMPEESFTRKQLVLNEAGERIMALGYLSRKYPEAKIIFSGGGGTLLRQHISEAEAIREYADMIGVPKNRLILETQSRSTAENAKFTKEIASPKDGETWLLVTSAWHMPRSIGVFQKAGFNVIAYPVDFRTRGTQDIFRTFAFSSEGLRRLDTGSKEWMGLIAYRLAGHTKELFPSPK